MSTTYSCLLQCTYLHEALLAAAWFMINLATMPAQAGHHQTLAHGLLWSHKRSVPLSYMRTSLPAHCLSGCVSPSVAPCIAPDHFLCPVLLFFFNAAEEEKEKEGRVSTPLFA